jgi:hypothetical protein
MAREGSSMYGDFHGGPGYSPGWQSLGDWVLAEGEGFEPPIRFPV